MESKQRRCFDPLITDLLKDMRLEDVVRRLKLAGDKVDPVPVAAMILDYEVQAARLQEAGETGNARRLSRRAAALKRLLRHGPEPARLLTETELPAGYAGKMLMMRVAGAGFEDMLILRIGDDWHREILRNTLAETADLGFRSADVQPLGGAYVRFDPDEGILIWGTSDEYGCCDKQEAARMIARAYPGKPIAIED